MLAQDAFETSSEMLSLMAFYAQQQVWVASQLAEQQPLEITEPASPAASTSSTVISSSSTRSTTPSSTASSSSPAPKVRIVLGKAFNRRTSVARKAPNTHYKWSSRVFPSSHPLRRLKKSRSQPQPGSRVILCARTIRRPSPHHWRNRKPSNTQSQRSTSQTPPVTKTTTTARSPSPEAVDLLVQYRAMIGDRMESCRRLQMMVQDSVDSGYHF